MKIKKAINQIFTDAEQQGANEDYWLFLKFIIDEGRFDVVCDYFLKKMTNDQILSCFDQFVNDLHRALNHD